MSPDEASLLEYAGQTVLQYIAIVVTRAIFFGFFMMLWTMAISSIWRRGFKSSAAVVYFISLALDFVIYAAFLALGIATTSTYVRAVLISNVDKSLDERSQLAAFDIRHWNNTFRWLGSNGVGILFWIGDAVVVWRACAMSPQNRTVKYTLIILYLCGIALAMSSKILVSIRDSTTAVTSVSSAEGITSIVGSVYFIGINVMATSIIAWHAHKNRLMFYANQIEGHSRALNVLALLTESGCIYCAVQIINLILTSIDDTYLSLMDRTARIWNELTAFASAIYPIVVVLIIYNQRSIADTPDASTRPQTTSAGFQFGEASFGRQDRSGFVSNPHPLTSKEKDPT